MHTLTPETDPGQVHPLRAPAGTGRRQDVRRPRDMRRGHAAHRPPRGPVSPGSPKGRAWPFQMPRRVKTRQSP